MIERVNDIDIAFDQRGAGSPSLLLLHGFSGSRRDFSDIMEDLSADRLVVAYDHRGHGDSTHTERQESYTLEAMGRDLDAFVAARRLAPCDLVGHSLGGILALRFALDHPDLVRSLILVSATAAPVAPIPPEVIGRLAQVGRQQGMPALARLLGRITDGPAAGRSEAQHERFLANVSRTDVEAYATIGVELGAFTSMLDEVAAFTLPVTVVFGEHDTLIQRGCEETAAAIPGAHLAVIPESAHAPHEENPGAWLAAVRAHLAALC